MTPAVWDDARSRIESVASSLGLQVEWPNEITPDRPGPTATTWLAIEAASNLTTGIEVDNKVWEERGSIWLHVMIPLGSGIRDGLVIRKELSNAFREATGLPVGLTYRDGQSFDPLDRTGTDDGVYAMLTLVVNYVYQDVST